MVRFKFVGCFLSFHSCFTVGVVGVSGGVRGGVGGGFRGGVGGVGGGFRSGVSGKFQVLGSPFLPSVFIRVSYLFIFISRSLLFLVLIFMPFSFFFFFGDFLRLCLFLHFTVCHIPLSSNPFHSSFCSYTPISLFFILSIPLSTYL